MRGLHVAWLIALLFCVDGLVAGKNLVFGRMALNGQAA
jgi:hypothetical protein